MRRLAVKDSLLGHGNASNYAVTARDQLETNAMPVTRVHWIVTHPMYYEARIIDGQFQIRSEPRGEWRIVYNPVADIANAMAALSEHDRMEVMALFCRSCGFIQPDGRGCQCWNDE